jgi:hypothetical protein
MDDESWGTYDFGNLEGPASARSRHSGEVVKDGAICSGNWWHFTEKMGHLPGKHGIFMGYP